MKTLWSWIKGISLALLKSPSFFKSILSKKVAYETALTRLQICNPCDKLDPVTRQCSICTCFVSLKVQYKNESCPLGKW